MSAQVVGVLAVMDPNRYPLDTRQRERMCEARAAVAELIEAAKEVDDCAEIDHSPWVDSTCDQCRALGRLRAALARVQGGDA